MMGLFVLAFLVLAVIIGPYLYTGTQLIDFARSLEGPSPEHLMGTDDLGRDLLGRVLNGGRISIAVGLTAVFIAITLGTTVGAIPTESTLSFLGLGFPSDVPTWGRLLFDAGNFIDIAPHWVIFPGLCIFVIVLSINFVGDGLRDALDPRRKI